MKQIVLRVHAKCILKTRPVLFPHTFVDTKGVQGVKNTLFAIQKNSI